ncbi:MAG: MFS transporter [Acidobacteria bacterium]|nr:MFS transporter [Acidobacteriota bacterium]
MDVTGLVSRRVPHSGPVTRIPRPVWLLGWASLFTDAATEMIYPLLPVFLSRVLGAGALSLGIIEGVAEGVNSLLKIASGWVSDRARRRRPIVIGGYALSSLARPFIALAATWPQVLLIRVLDRTGKGVRGAPRDAMLAQSATPATRGRVFGFHRAMDHTGAIAGPVAATVFLLFAPGEYRPLFALTAIPGAIAVALLFLVPEPAASSSPQSRGTVAEVDSRTSDGRRGGPSGPPSPALPRPLVAFLAVLLVFSLGNSADVFLLLRLSEALGSATYVPLLWSGIHVVKASLSTWGGSLSDRLGRKQVIVMGWAVYAVVYLGFATASTAASLVGWFLLYGAYFAFTEGAEKALVADLTPAPRHGTAFGAYNAALGMGALAASVTFGFLYERFGASVAFGVGAALAAVAAVLLVFIRTPNTERHQP